MNPVLVAVVVAIVALVSSAPGAPLDQAQAQPPLFGGAQDPIAGARVFGARGCVKCHAVNGVGGKVGPDLGKTSRSRSFYDLAAALWNHAPRMADRMQQLGIPRPSLDAQQTGDLVAYLFTLDYFDPRGRPDRGRRLFTEKRCILCHQVAGTGGVVGPNLDAAVQHSAPIYLATAMWNHGPQMLEVMRARRIARPTFQESELRDLIAFISEAAPGVPEGPLYVLPGRADEGRRLFVERRCAECHSAGGQGGRVGPDLSERAAGRSLMQFATAMWNKTPAMVNAMRSRSVSLPELTAEEMADVVGYLYSVRYFSRPGAPADGAKVAAAKGCLGCHGVRGEGGKAAMDLSQSTSLESPAAIMSALWNHGFLTAPAAERARGPRAEMTGAEMSDLMAYLQALRRPQ